MSRASSRPKKSSALPSEGKSLCFGMGRLVVTDSVVVVGASVVVVVVVVVKSFVVSSDLGSSTAGVRLTSFLMVLVPFNSPVPFNKENISYSHII